MVVAAVVVVAVVVVAKWWWLISASSKQSALVSLTGLASNCVSFYTKLCSVMCHALVCSNISIVIIIAIV